MFTMGRGSSCDITYGLWQDGYEIADHTWSHAAASYAAAGLLCDGCGVAAAPCGRCHLRQAQPSMPPRAKRLPVSPCRTDATGRP